MAVFASAGNTFPDPEKFELKNLHSTVGIGLRLGVIPFGGKIGEPPQSGLAIGSLDERSDLFNSVQKKYLNTRQQSLNQ